MSMTVREEIRDLIAYSAYLYDAKEPDLLAALYAATGSFTTVVKGGGTFGPTVGREALRQRFQTRMAARTDQLRHVVSNTWFREESEARVVAISNLTLFVVEDSGPRVQATGIYTDTFVRDGGRWVYESKSSELDFPFEIGRASCRERV